MESIWFILTVPVFYIIGLVAFVRWCLNGGRSANTAERQKLAANLRVRADGLSGEARKALLNVADDFSMGLLPDVPAAAPGTAALSPAGMPPTHAAQTPASSSSWTSQDIEAVFAKLDNINVLLYLGAFLIVVSAGIFVGANFSTLSGGFKTGFLALFTALFYGVGLTLYLRFAKLRPAGAVFTAIGLILIPMVGLAAYNFTSAHEVGRLLWFGTSLIALGAYVLTLLVTRQTYVAYLMGFTTLSLFESSISLINLPLQWFGWGMTVVALLLLLASRRAGWWQDAASALRICAHLFVPISVLFSLGVINSQGWGQVGITLGLAGFFYGVLAYREAATPSGAVYWVLAAAALPAGLAVGLHDLLPASQLALLLCVTSLAYAWLGWAARRPLPHQWREYLGIVAGVTPLLAAGLAYSSPTTILYALLTGIGVSAFFALTLRQAALALLALLPAWIVPYELFRQVMMPAADWGYVAAGYVVLGCLLVAWRRLLTGWPDSGDQVGITGYAVAFGLATCTAVIGGSTVLFWTSLALGAAIYLVGYLERSIACVYLAAAFGYLAAWQLVDIGQQPTSVGAIILLLAGAAIYASEFLARDADRGQALRYAGLTGPFLGALFTAGTASDSLAPIAALAGGGLLLATEAYRQQRAGLLEAAAAVLLLAFDWYLQHEGVSQTQAYTLPWAAYVAALAYRRRADARDLCTALALAILTFPIAGQALGADGQLYGLELILVALALVVLGMSLRYQLVMYWGIGTLVVEVLYQLRDVFYALPKYVISAALGLALLGVGIYLLQRRRNN